MAKLSDPHRVEVTHRIGEKGVIDCGRGGIRIQHPEQASLGDRPKPLDYEGPICAGTQHDLFPATTVYVVATFEEPNVKHYDPTQKAYVVGPVTSKLFYQFSGIKDVPAAFSSQCHKSCPEKSPYKGDDDEKGRKPQAAVKKNTQERITPLGYLLSHQRFDSPTKYRAAPRRQFFVL